MNGIASAAALFGIYAALILDVFSSTNSSPQTTELFASERADSLWRWVRIGAIVSVAFIGLGAYTAYREGKSFLAPIAGGFVALALMWTLYSHALAKGGGTSISNTVSRGMDW
jgi:hypothetical protein